MGFVRAYGVLRSPQYDFQRHMKKGFLESPPIIVFVWAQISSVRSRFTLEFSVDAVRK